jgi:short-chain Z-isoprenyl diphosphate synthase
MKTMPEGARRGLRTVVYDLYERRLVRKLKARHDPVPRHVGVILDGNRRWAKSVGATSKEGHQAGADKIEDLLRWCDDAGVEVVTLWLLSTDNLNRPDTELSALLGIIENVVVELARPQNRWTLNVVGALDLLPAETAQALKEAASTTGGRPGVLVNIAVCYGGRREIADAVRSLLQAHAAQGASLEEVAEFLDVEHIAQHLYTRGQPDPDLIIRTSGEQRLGGFMLWQSARSEFYFCEAYWPDFRRVDFLRALRDYGARQRRFGS